MYYIIYEKTLLLRYIIRLKSKFKNICCFCFSFYIKKNLNHLNSSTKKKKERKY